MKTLMYLLYIGLGTLVLFQGSRVISTAVESRLLDVPYVSADPQPVQEDMNPGIGEQYDIALFSSPLFGVQQQEAGAGSAGGPVLDPALLSRYQLLGTVVKDKGSLALIRGAGERQPSVYKIGDLLDRYEIVRIQRHQVVVSDGARQASLIMYEEQKPGPRPQQRQAARQQPQQEKQSSRTVQKILSRSEVEEKVFKRVNQILTQIAISPYMVDGNMEGLRLIRVPNDSIVYELGGRNGDIIRRVNGHQVNQIDQMYKLWENIKDDSLITVDLERGSQMYSYRFDIRE
jgi:general secretion pathway protein C